MTEAQAPHETPRSLPEALRGSHRVRQRGFMAVYPLVMIPVATAAAVLFYRAGQWPPAVVWSVAVPLFVVAEVLRRRERVELHAEGVTVHRGLRPRRITWAQVHDIHVPNRWRGETTIDLAEQRGVALRGVDEATAQGLVNWFHGRPSTPA